MDKAIEVTRIVGVHTPGGGTDSYSMPIIVQLQDDSGAFQDLRMSAADAMRLLWYLYRMRIAYNLPFPSTH